MLIGTKTISLYTVTSS